MRITFMRGRKGEMRLWILIGVWEARRVRVIVNSGGSELLLE